MLQSQHRGRPGDQRQPVASQHLHKQGKRHDEKQFLHIEQLSAEISEVQPSHHLPDNDHCGYRDGQPLQTEDQSLHQWGPFIQSVFYGKLLHDASPKK